jgi:hypothetical protein
MMAIYGRGNERLSAGEHLKACKGMWVIGEGICSIELENESIAVLRFDQSSTYWTTRINGRERGSFQSLAEAMQNAERELGLHR